MGFIDYWLMALFFIDYTDFWPKILLTTDFSAAEVND